MVELIIKNINEVEKEFHKELEELCHEKSGFFKELFKKYDKEMTLEVIFDHSSAVYKVSASLNLKSKKVLVVEESKDVIKAATAVFNALKKAVKRQYELERKDYEYKRKNRK
jgi:ribosome-associated translation inhibitor RaiA